MVIKPTWLQQIKLRTVWDRLAAGYAYENFETQIALFLHCCHKLYLIDHLHGFEGTLYCPTCLKEFNAIRRGTRTTDNKNSVPSEKLLTP
ncbi:MAG TPA: hypothetical protein VLV31_00020 [Candidatus Acidoferrales bacterium]|nr:hypothetical protein [Candidatus Acidoferrales bacterium]